MEVAGDARPDNGPPPMFGGVTSAVELLKLVNASVHDMSGGEMVPICVQSKEREGMQELLLLLLLLLLLFIVIFSFWILS